MEKLMELKLNKTNKRGQEEIMGFMLVILLVVVIGMTMLFLFRPADKAQNDAQLENLLYSILATSVDGQSISVKIGDCSKEIGCEEMEKSIEEVMETAFSESGTVIGKNLRGYKLSIEGSVSYTLERGNLTGTSKGAANVIGSSHDLVRLTFYY